MADQHDVNELMKLVIHDHRVAAAKDMRESAAKLFDEPLSVETLPVQSHGGLTATAIDLDIRKALAAMIRALPIDPETGGADG